MSLNQRDQPITEQKDAVMFAELRQLRLCADLSEEDVEQLYKIEGERRADDTRRRGCTQQPGALIERRLIVGSLLERSWPNARYKGPDFARHRTLVRSQHRPLVKAAFCRQNVSRQ